MPLPICRYRVAVLSGLAGLFPLTALGQAPDISQLDTDTRTSIEIACAGSKTEGPALYRKCVAAQLASIEGSGPPPDISQLDTDTRISIEIACAGPKTEGPAPYRQCLSTQLASIEGSGPGQSAKIIGATLIVRFL